MGSKKILLAITTVVGLEPTYLTTKSDKGLVIVKKVKKAKPDRRSIKS